MATKWETVSDYTDESHLRRALQRFDIHNMASNQYQIDHEYIFFRIPILLPDIFEFFVPNIHQKPRSRTLSDVLHSIVLIMVAIFWLLF